MGHCQQGENKYIGGSLCNIPLSGVILPALVHFYLGEMGLFRAADEQALAWQSSMSATSLLRAWASFHQPKRGIRGGFKQLDLQQLGLRKDAEYGVGKRGVKAALGRCQPSAETQHQVYWLWLAPTSHSLLPERRLSHLSAALA